MAKIVPNLSLCFLVTCCLVVVAKGESCPTRKDLVENKPATLDRWTQIRTPYQPDATIITVVWGGGESGFGCRREEAETGTLQLEWALARLLKTHRLQSVEPLGLRALWRPCNSSSVADIQLSLVLGANCHDNADTTVLTTSVSARLSNLLTASDGRVVRMQQRPLWPQVATVADLLTRNDIAAVALVAPSQDVSSVGEQLAEKGVCVLAECPLPTGDRDGLCHEPNDLHPAVTVFVGSRDAVTKSLQTRFSTSLAVVVIQTDDEYFNAPKLMQNRTLIHVGRGDSTVFIPGAVMHRGSSVVEIVEVAFRTWRSLLPEEEAGTDVYSPEDVLRSLNISLHQPTVNIRVLKRSSGTHIQPFFVELDKVEEELSLGRLSRNETWHRTPVSRTCLNVPQSMVSQFVLVPELWMVVVLTTAAILSCVAVCIVIYLAVKSCDGSTTEGSQWLSVVILLSSLLLYLCLLPYACQATPFVCTLRMELTGLAYTTAFAALLARSILLATSDSPGLVGHVSGVVQLALMLALIAVQGGLCLQRRMTDWPRLVLPSNEYRCGIGGVQWLLTAVLWPSILLLLQLLVTPTTVRSRRNYKEGLLFCIASVLIVAIWAGWLTLYLLRPEFESLAVAGGLVLCPSVIIITVFIPKTYIIATSIVESRCVSRADSLGAINYQTNSAYYDHAGRFHDSQEAINPQYADQPSIIYNDLSSNTGSLTQF